MPRRVALALAAAALVGAPAAVRGHGRMTSPAARNGGDNGAVAGGPGTVHAFHAAGDHLKYQHGVCGNAPGTRQTYNAVGDLKATYTAGDTIEIEVQITAHHVGYFEFDLCLDAGRLSEECFSQHRLLRSGCDCACPGDPSNSCEACSGCRWFWKAVMQGELSQSVTEGYAGPVLPGGGNLVPYNFKMFYVLPEMVRSSNAVIRWHYMTTNSCTSGASAPEEFWNCADVAIKDSSGSTGPAVSYDNAALEGMAVHNLMPAITAGTLKGINYACPTDSAGDLLGVGAADEYHCGGADEDPGPYEYCASASGGSSVFDCTGIGSSAINCEAECGVWYYQCVRGTAYMKPVASGTLCRGGAFVLASACDGYTPPSITPDCEHTTPAPTSTPTAAVPTEGAPTPSPTRGHLHKPTDDTPGDTDSKCRQFDCIACLANNHVCYGQTKQWCDMYDQYVWCGTSEEDDLGDAGWLFGPGALAGGSGPGPADRGAPPLLL